MACTLSPSTIAFGLNSLCAPNDTELKTSAVSEDPAIPSASTILSPAAFSLQQLALESATDSTQLEGIASEGCECDSDSEGLHDVQVSTVLAIS